MFWLVLMISVGSVLHGSRFMKNKSHIIIPVYWILKANSRVASCHTMPYLDFTFHARPWQNMLVKSFGHRHDDTLGFATILARNLLTGNLLTRYDTAKCHSVLDRSLLKCLIVFLSCPFLELPTSLLRPPLSRVPFWSCFHHICGLPPMFHLGTNNIGIAERKSELHSWHD